MDSRVMLGHPLNIGRVGWWLGLPRLAGGGQFFDVMGRFPGSLYGSIAWSRKGPPGHPSLSVATSTSGDGVNAGGIPAALGSLANPFSFGGWCNPAGAPTGGSGVSTVVGVIQSAGSYHLSVGFDSSLRPKISSIGESPGQSATPQAANTWTHLLLVWNGSTLTLYTNGRLDYGFTPSTTNWQSSDQFRFGHTASGAGVGVGNAADVSFWSRALSAAEVQRLYDESRRGYPRVLRGTGPRMVSLIGVTSSSPAARWGIGDDGPNLGFFEG